MQYPPYIYLRYIGDHIQMCLGTYLDLWEMKDEDCRIFCKREDIVNERHLSWPKFYNDIRKLARNDLLEYAWADNVLVVTLASVPDDLEGWLPC